MRNRGGRYALAASIVTHGGLVVLLWSTLAIADRPPVFPAELRSEVVTPQALEEPLREPTPEPPQAPAEPETPTLRDEPPPEDTEPFAPLPDIPSLEPAIALTGIPAHALPPLRRPRRPPPPEEAATPPPVRVSVKAPSGPCRTSKPADDNPAPRYPVRAMKAGIEGTVLLEVSVTPGGAVAKVVLKKSSGHGILDREALRAVNEWRFLPALHYGRAVAARVEVPIRFALH